MVLCFKLGISFSNIDSFNKILEYDSQSQIHTAIMSNQAGGKTWKYDSPLECTKYKNQVTFVK